MALKAVFLDCDGTLTTVRSSWEYLHRRLGLWTDKADEYQELFRAGEIDYHEFCRRDALLWKGLSASHLRSVISEIPYQPDARELVRRFKKAGIITAIVSTGLTALVEKVREDLSVDLSFSNDLLEAGGFLTGEILINVDYDMKGHIVRRILGELGVSFDEASAIGDGEGDRGMFEEVCLPVGFRMNGNRDIFPARTIYVDHLHEIFQIPGIAA